VTGRIDVIAPATITVVNGGTVLSSLAALPPYGITVTDPDSGDALTLTVVAANPATLSASAAGGAGVVANGNTLVLTGTPVQVNAALASLSLQEPANATSDRLALTANDPSVLPANTDIAVRITPAGTLGFAAPPLSLTIQPNALAVLPGLILGDPAASALAAAGQGRDQVLEIVLTVGAGILLLPGLSPVSGIIVSGQGSGTMALVFTADQLNTVNAALAGLTYAGPGNTQLNYSMTNLSGPLGAALTYGQLALVSAGSIGANGSLATGHDTVILGPGSGAVDITGLTAETGNFSGGIFVGVAGTLEMPSGVLSLSGTSEDFGALAATALDVTGTAIFADGGDIGGEISISAHGMIDFGGTLIAGGSAKAAGQLALSLAANAVLLGSGTLSLGNAGRIAGPGTLLAASGDTLLVAAGSISGGASLLVSGGGVLELGSGLTLDSSVTLGFEPGYGMAPVTGRFSDSLLQDGGVIVLDDPLGLNASITGFAPGDRLVLPKLTAVSLSDITSQSFVVSGTTSADQLEQFTLHAAIPSGMTLVLGSDAEGDAQIGLSAAGPELFLDGASFAAGQIDASGGVGQTLLGLQLLVPGWTTQSLTLTLSVGAGVLAYGTVTPAASLVLSAASPAVLNALLADVSYTARISAGSDTLTASGATGLLAGLHSAVPIAIEPGGTVAGFATAPTDEQTALFAGSTGAAVLVTSAAAPGAVIVLEVVDFADVLAVGGIGGMALSVDAGGTAVFDAGSAVTLAANAVIGDANGAGTLGIATGSFSIGTPEQNADLLIGGSAGAGASVAEITGAVTVAGDVAVGSQAAALLDVSGTLDTSQMTIGAAGTLIGNGNAVIAFGDLADSGMATLQNAAQGTAQQLVLSGQLTLGGGTTLSGLSSAVIANGGTLDIAPDAAFSGAGLNALSGSVFDQGALLLGGNLVSGGAITLAGGLLDAAAVTLSSGSTLSGNGNVVAAGIGAKIALTGGEIRASNGLLSLDGNVSISSGSIGIAGGAALDLIQSAAGGAIGFAGSGAVLTVDNLAEDSSAVTGMLAGDVIDLIGVAPGQVTFSGGTISATDGSGNVLGGFALGVAATQPAVSIVSDGAGGALITLGGEMACFARGSRLLTPNGYVPVEAFKPGDPVITRLGIRRAVRWIGRRNLAVDLKARQDMRPVLVQPGAFGLHQPSRPVRLSPSHAVFVDGVLVPVRHLVNGATILREGSGGMVTYFHIELDRHDVLMAEGLPVESYLDTGNRGEFQHELGVRGSCRKACAKVVTGGPALARIRWRLHETALRAGFTLAQAPSLRGIIGTHTVMPEIRMNGAMRVAHFTLPRSADCIRLLARTAVPAETDPDSDDRRELALCLRQPRATSHRLQLGPGWYPKAPGDAGIWMSGAGEIFFAPVAMELTLNLLAVARSWQLPVG
jgi:hypothetical protein